jgi:hypothetical protein
VQDAPGRVGTQQSALLVVADLIEHPGDSVLGAGEVRVALGQRADGDQERPQVRERRGLLELVERGVRERELAAGQATRDVVGGTAVKPGVDAARLLAVKERLAQPGHRLADHAVVGEQFVEAVGGDAAQAQRRARPDADTLADGRAAGAGRRGRPVAAAAQIGSAVAGREGDATHPAAAAAASVAASADRPARAAVDDHARLPAGVAAFQRLCPLRAGAAQRAAGRLAAVDRPSLAAARARLMAVGVARATGAAARRAIGCAPNDPPMLAAAAAVGHPGAVVAGRADPARRGALDQLGR